MLNFHTCWDSLGAQCSRRWTHKCCSTTASAGKQMQMAIYCSGSYTCCGGKIPLNLNQFGQKIIKKKSIFYQPNWENHWAQSVQTGEDHGQLGTISEKYTRDNDDRETVLVAHESDPADHDEKADQEGDVHDAGENALHGQQNVARAMKRSERLFLQFISMSSTNEKIIAISVNDWSYS